MRNEIRFENIVGVHLELTTKCNAMCPMCNRNFKGKIRKNLEIIDLSLNDIKKIFKSTFIKQLKLISLCGVYGEPICNKEIKQIIQYFYSCNSEVKIDLYTNGSLYAEEWWKDLANIMKPHNGTVIFGIDGDETTHSLHRCNTDYSKIIKNAKAYIGNGGIAQWDYIVFKHNEDYVKKAEKLSKDLGFKNFQIKKTSRFLKNFYEKDDCLDSTILSFGKHPVFDNNGEIKYCIELPTIKEYRNNNDLILEKMIKKYGSVEKYFDQVKIDCDAIRSGGIFVSAKGEVFPCCSVYQQICYKTVHKVTDETELNEYKLYKNDNISALNKNIEEIVNGKFFKNLIHSFTCDSIKNGKPKCCSRTCGKEIDYQGSCHTQKISYRR